MDAALDARGYRPAEGETGVVSLDFARRPPREGGAECVENAPSTQWLEAHARCSGSRAKAEQEQRDIQQALAVPTVFAGLARR